MKITYCKYSGASYVYVSDKDEWTAHKTKEIAPGVIVDFDEEGMVLGIEILGATKPEVEEYEYK